MQPSVMEVVIQLRTSSDNFRDLIIDCFGCRPNARVFEGSHVNLGL
jgi:hypothetical protein